MAHTNGRSTTTGGGPAAAPPATATAVAAAASVHLVDGHERLVDPGCAATVGWRRSGSLEGTGRGGVGRVVDHHGTQGVIDAGQHLGIEDDPGGHHVLGELLGP